MHVGIMYIHTQIICIIQRSSIKLHIFNQSPNRKNNEKSEKRKGTRERHTKNF